MCCIVVLGVTSVKGSIDPQGVMSHRLRTTVPANVKAESSRSWHGRNTLMVAKYERMCRDKVNHFRLCPWNDSLILSDLSKSYHYWKHLPGHAYICVLVLFQAVLRFPISNKYDSSETFQFLAINGFHLG